MIDHFTKPFQQAISTSQFATAAGMHLSMDCALNKLSIDSFCQGKTRVVY
jgi:hypothetical protein